MCVCVCIDTPHITQCYTESRTGSDSLEGPTRLEGFAAIEFNEIFSGKQPCHDTNVFRSFRDRPHLQRVAGGFVVFVLSSQQQHAEDGHGVSA